MFIFISYSETNGMNIYAVTKFLLKQEDTMKKNMIIITIVLACILTCGTVSADAFEAKERTEQTKTEQSISSNLKSTVAKILSNYDSATLTAANAKAINNAFREAGVRRGPGQQEAIEAAGFDPRKISSLDPPPEESSGRGMNNKRQQ